MSNAILFHGDDGNFVVEAMRKKAMEVLHVSSKEALFSHGDYQEVMPTSKTYLYSMESIHSVVEESSLPPFSAKKRIIALLSADRMLPVHANALLKTLEDAPESFVMYLTTTAYNDIIKTILSRVQKVHVEGLGELKDYTAQIDKMSVYLKEARFESFFKEVEALEKEMIEDNSLTEGKLRNFLEQFMRESIKSAPSHLKAAVGRDLLATIQRAINAFHGNIRIKYIMENLFLSNQPLGHSTR